MSLRHSLGTAFNRLDALLSREVRRLRARYQLSLDEFRGLYVSDERVDALLKEQNPDDGIADMVPVLDGGPVWSNLARQFQLSPLAQDVLLLAAAVDIDPKYAPIIAYLNDDVSLRWPINDLARRLFATTPERAAELPRVLGPEGKLFGPRLLVTMEHTERKPAALCAFAPAPCLADVLIGAAPRLPAAMSFVQTRPAARPGTEQSLNALLPLLGAAERKPLVLLQGEWGSGREAAAAALASAVNLRLLKIELTAWGSGPETQTRWADAVLLARLHRAALYISGDGAAPDASLAALASSSVPVFIATPAKAAAWIAALKTAPVAALSFPVPDAAERSALWQASLKREGVTAAPDSIEAAAANFRLTPRRIAHAAEAVRINARASSGEAAVAGTAEILAAARAQATIGLSGLAQPVESRHLWSDLVLPAGTFRQLREFANAIVNRDRVFREWGFLQGSGGGLAVLMAGGSGTGKTMSAGVVAREVGLDLWRIDLSAVISKYIGETEKHLDRIFNSAADGNAILFFDEADALFGKRSEVKDAHDRYANIEVAYLLQRLEAHDGVSILATNLAKNVDPAFSRRMHAVIEFPLPDAGSRERLWRKSFGAAAPVAADVDFNFLAAQFVFAGGDIRVAALDAAFLAAAAGGDITMATVIQAVARQMLKQGKVPSITEFRHHYGLLGGGASRASVA